MADVAPLLPPDRAAAAADPSSAERFAAAPDGTKAGANASEARRAATSEFEFAPSPDVLDRTFESEAVDPEWAPRVEAQIYRSVIDSGLRVVSLDAQCKTSICRLVLTHDSAAKTAAELQPLWNEVRAMTTALIESSGASVQSSTIQGTIDPSQPLPITVVYVNRTGNTSTLSIRTVPRPAPASIP